MSNRIDLPYPQSNQRWLRASCSHSRHCLFFMESRISKALGKVVVTSARPIVVGASGRCLLPNGTMKAPQCYFAIEKS